MTAGPAELRLMLFDGALKFIEHGRRGLVDKDYEAAFTGISRAQKIIAELVSSLDPKHAPDLCERLTGLYTFMITRLMVASHERDPAIVEEVIKLLQFERETWVMLIDKLADEVAAGDNIAQTHDLGPGQPADSDAPPAPKLIGGRISYRG
jgi:flagellar protein FliS